MSTQAFLTAIARFCSGRGCPLLFYSDNGTTFASDSNLLKRELKQFIDDIKFHMVLSSLFQSLDLQATLQEDPHMGGCADMPIQIKIS